MNFSDYMNFSTTTMIIFENCSTWNDTFLEMTSDQNGSTRVRPPSDKWSPPTLTNLQLVVVVLYILIFCLAVIGNILVILTLVQNKRMRTVTNVLLLNLAVSDLLLAVFCMPFTATPMLMQNFIFGGLVCIMIRYFQGKQIIAEVRGIIFFILYVSACSKCNVGLHIKAIFIYFSKENESERVDNIHIFFISISKHLKQIEF